MLVQQVLFVVDILYTRHGGGIGYALRAAFINQTWIPVLGNGMQRHYRVLVGSSNTGSFWARIVELTDVFSAVEIISRY